MVMQPHFRCHLLALALFVGTSFPGMAAGASPADHRAIAGSVNLVGAYSKPKALPVFKNRSFCGGSVANETLLVDQQGGVRNAVVLLRPLGAKVFAPATALTLDNRRCAFTPHVQVGAVGSELLLKNSDPILHTVHARLGGETLFNVGLPRWRQVTKRLDRPGVVRIDCDVLHTWMSAAIVVTDTPYAVVTDERGRFFFDEMPIGAYELEVWHERLGTRRQQVHLTTAQDARIEVVYSAKSIAGAAIP